MPRPPQGRSGAIGRLKTICTVLDVVMNDDDHRARKDHAPENFAILRRIALNIIKGNPDKGSNRGEFQGVGWDNNFLTKLIQGF